MSILRERGVAPRRDLAAMAAPRRAVASPGRSALCGLTVFSAFAAIAFYSAASALTQELEARVGVVPCLVQNLTGHDVKYTLANSAGDAQPDVHWDYVSRGNRRALQQPARCAIAAPADGADLSIAWSRYAPDRAAGSTRTYRVSFPGMDRPQDPRGLVVRLYPKGRAAGRYLDGITDVDVTAGLASDSTPAGWTTGHPLGTP